MPFIDSVKRIKVEDFPQDQQETAAKIGEVYNFFAEQVTNVLNGNVDFDNLNRKKIELTVTTDSSGKPTTETRFSTDLGLVGTKVLRADNLTNSVSYPTGSPFISYTSSGGGIYTIRNITNLPANNKFRLVIELVF